MAGDRTLSLVEAITEYLADLKGGQRQSVQQELNRFIRWCGRDRQVSALLPTEMAEYAELSGVGSTDATRRLAPVKSFLSFLKKRDFIHTSLAPHLKAAKAKRTNLARSQQLQEASVLTSEGYTRIQARLELLKEERINVRKDIELAMADKDFKENSPLDAAKEQQGFIESTIRELEGVLARAVVSQGGVNAPDRRVRLGNKVVLKDLQSGKRLRYTLVDTQEVDPSAGKISAASPVGRAMMDRAEGDEVQIVAPRGTLRYVIEKVES